MRRAILTSLAILGWLVVFDLLVAGVLATGAVPSLERYFDYGRSVPGKLAEWQARPGMAGNMAGAGWISSVIGKTSAEDFAAEDAQAGPVIRGYGMSFSNHILRAAERARPGLALDLAGAPAAPPNWAYAAFLADAGNRRAGDVAVLGVLSSAVPGTLSLSNRTRNFEQPAPLTYPIFRADGAGGLLRIDPMVTDLEEERALSPDATRAWAAELRAQDALWSPAAFAAPWLDVSPFARLVRRALATSDIDARRARIARNPELWQAGLETMLTDFAARARAEGMTPVVLLIQTRGPEAPDLARLRPALAAAGVATLATVDHVDPARPVNFLADGHYTDAANDRLGAAFIELIDGL